MSKDIKHEPDGFETVENVLSKTEQYIEDNRKSLTIIIVAIAIVVGGYLSYQRFYIAPKEVEAQGQMFVAERYFELDSFQIALEGDGTYYGFLEIIDEYRGTKSANLARYYAGISYLQMEQYEEAIENLNKFDANDRLVSTIALGAIGDAYVELEDLKKGVSYYEKAAAKVPNELTSAIYLKKAGIVYEEMGQAKKALAAYETIKKEFPASEEAREIDKYIAAVKLKL
ncbi:MAG: tetratricopeptide repeat protein [Bacteroidota bacterium]|nr:MAG: tetratricopeptide repeat protein [Bacteroidota bacterium]